MLLVCPYQLVVVVVVEEVPTLPLTPMEALVVQGFLQLLSHPLAMVFLLLAVLGQHGELPLLLLGLRLPITLAVLAEVAAVIVRPSAQPSLMEQMVDPPAVAAAAAVHLIMDLTLVQEVMVQTDVL
jgi:hypothetical protein